MRFFSAVVRLAKLIFSIVAQLAQAGLRVALARLVAPIALTLVLVIYVAARTGARIVARTVEQIALVIKLPAPIAQ